MTNFIPSKGNSFPLGAHVLNDGVNFALFSEHAKRVELCVFEKGKSQVFPVTEHTDQIWHIHLKSAKVGLQYAYKVYGDNANGGRFDPDSLLLDPYAREVSGQFTYDYTPNSAHGLLAEVIDESLVFADENRPNTPLENSVLYEIHVKGASQLHPEIPEKLRGTYAGLAGKPMIAHFKKLGITAVNLLPVHGFIDEYRLVNNQLKNYWGYNTLNFFAPEKRYAADPKNALNEFRQMVKTLHQEGLEVILDVVYNHTAESDEFGPTLSFRGIDNASYYKLPPDNPAAYLNFSGCGNTFNLSHPRVLQLVMDSLRYWVTEMHIDGFRFDLAAALTRESAFLDAVRQDPVLAKVKLIAEPWDIGWGGYQLGAFHAGWSEWNDKFRDDMRAFWLTKEVGVGAFAERIAGSAAIFNHHCRNANAGVNFITAHDGFTLADLVSYVGKHNEANGENNRDGNSSNVSTNCGEEGSTGDPAILSRRKNLQKALIASLSMAKGVPMLQGFDELGRTQNGNNNAYCQDNALTWTDWSFKNESLVDFFAGLIALRKRFPQLTANAWLNGQTRRDGFADISWLHPDNRAMNDVDWQHTQSLGFLLAPLENTPSSEMLLVLVNRQTHAQSFHLPEMKNGIPLGNAWEKLCDTAQEKSFTPMKQSGKVELAAESVQIFAQGI